MPDAISRLREADPLSFLPAADDDPPSAVLERIVATPPEPPRRRRSPRVAVVAAAGLALALAVLAVAFAPSGGPSLAERAYAATSAADEIVYSVTTLTQTGAGIDSEDRTEMWQYRDRMHDVMDIEQRGKRYRYEHDQRGEVFRTLYDGRVDSIRADDPGWRDNEGREGFAQNLQTVVDRFRSRLRGARDAGETTFNGRPAHAYRAGDETLYVDPDSALPLGSARTVRMTDADGKPAGELRVVMTVDRFERLAPTPENLAKLDAPAIDAAQ